MIRGSKLKVNQNFLMSRQNSIATILSLGDSSQVTEQFTTDCHGNDLVFKGNIISVSAYNALSPLAKMFRLRKNDLGIWSKKRRVSLEIGKQYAIETSLSDNQVLALFEISSLCFSLNSTGKRYQFVLQGKGYGPGGDISLFRTYEVGSAEELNIWYSQFAIAKNEEEPKRIDSTTFIPDIEIDEVDLSEQEYCFWRDYQRCIKVLERSAQMFPA